MKELSFKTSGDWRTWLRDNHDKEAGIWLVFYKKGSGEPSVDYESAVEEALCFGWIDSIIKGIDEKRYKQKFTPRNESSRWSESNRKRVARLIEHDRMTEFGLAKITAAKRNGQWDKPGRPEIPSGVPEEFRAALNRNRKAEEAFNRLSPSYRRQYIGWIFSAKRPETRERRIREAIGLLENGQKLGMK